MYRYIPTRLLYNFVIGLCPRRVANHRSSHRAVYFITVNLDKPQLHPTRSFFCAARTAGLEPGERSLCQKYSSIHSENLQLRQPKLSSWECVHRRVRKRWPLILKLLNSRSYLSLTTRSPVPRFGYDASKFVEAPTWRRLNQEALILTMIMTPTRVPYIK